MGRHNSMATPTTGKILLLVKKIYMYHKLQQYIVITTSTSMSWPFDSKHQQTITTITLVSSNNREQMFFTKPQTLSQINYKHYTMNQKEERHTPPLATERVSTIIDYHNAIDCIDHIITCMLLMTSK